MKYRIVVQKLEEKETSDSYPFFNNTAFSREFHNVFEAEIGADEAIELGKHLWDISNRRKSTKNNEETF